MELENDSFVEEFLNACYDGDLSKVQQGLATGRLSTGNLDEGLADATGEAHTEIVAALFDAGARITTSAVDSLPGAKMVQDVRIVRLFLDHGLEPNATQSSGEPVLAYVSAYQPSNPGPRADFSFPKLHVGSRVCSRVPLAGRRP